MTRRNLFRHGLLVRTLRLEAQTLDAHREKLRKGDAAKLTPRRPFAEFARLSDEMLTVPRR